MTKAQEAIKTTTEAMNLLYDTMNPMPKSAIMSKLSKIKLFLESLPPEKAELEPDLPICSRCGKPRKMIGVLWENHFDCKNRRK